MYRYSKSLNQIVFGSEIEKIRSQSFFNQLSVRALKSDNSLWSCKAPDIGTRIKLRRLILNMRGLT
jgi:hypothetical protein